MIETCQCFTTQGREGETGSWCLKCGRKVWEVHDKPCLECRHHTRHGPGGFGGSSTCRKNLMAVTPTMRVRYSLEPERHGGRGGLCFEPLDPPAAEPGEEARKPFWVKCRLCAHCWAIAFLPMEMGAFAKVAQGAACPMCGDKKPVIPKQSDGVLLEDAA